MGSNEILNSYGISGDREMSISGLREKHQQELETLGLISQPFKTLKLFILAFILYIRQSAAYLLSHSSWFIPLSVIIVAVGFVLVTFEGPYGKDDSLIQIGLLYFRPKTSRCLWLLIDMSSAVSLTPPSVIIMQPVEEIQHYVQFGLWWVALGVASSIGLGSGLHTFVLYLGPHIAFFTIKAMKCGRVDIKSASYDTIQLKRGPSWLGKDCAEFGPPLFPSSDGVCIPLSSILPQIQLEAILWGLGTALGELPPYFISRAASLSGGTVYAVEELDASSPEDEGFLSARLTQIKRWFLSHAQYLNFFTILILASVPNPLFDLAGIMCGQFGIPFWEFFLATVIGKAIIKTHIQTVFIISVCNNQLLHWMENELLWLSSFVPGFSSVMPKLITMLHSVKDKYMAAKPHVPSTVKATSWDFSLASIWNTVVWIMLMNFFVKIVNATAQGYLKKQQDSEIAALKNKSSEPPRD